MRLERNLIVTLVFTLGLPGIVAAQSNETPQNLQVLPREMSREDVLEVMRGFNAALGVRCGHCHIDAVRSEPRDFAADDKPAKNVSRAMMRMVDAINRMVDTINNEYMAEMQEHEAAHDGGAEHDHGEVPVQVRCVTCHRGQEHPYLLSDLLSAVHEEEGIDAAIGRYHELRDRYYGSHTYDFSERSLNKFAEQLLAAESVDDALTILELNVGEHPDSADAHMLMGQARLQRGDRQAAAQHLDQAVELDPENRRAVQLLNRLRRGQGGR